MHHALFSAASLFLLGILLAPRLSLNPYATWACLLVLGAASIVLARRRRRWPAHACLLAAITTAGLLRAQVGLPALDLDDAVNVIQPGPATVTGVLGDDPVASDRQLSVPLRVGTYGTGNAGRGMRGQVVLKLPAGAPELVYGDAVRVEGWASFEREDGITPVVTLRAREAPRKLGHAPPSRWMDRALSLRRRMDAVLKITHAPAVVPFLRGALLGEPVEDDALRQVLERTGAYHLVSVSGLHLAVLAISVTVFCGWLGMGRRSRVVVTMAVMLLAVLTWGARVTVVRAGIVALVFGFGRLFARPVSPYTSLAASALVIMAYDPGEVFRFGFQMSLVAVLAVVYLTPALMTLLDVLPPYLNAWCSAALAASLGTAPIMALHTGAVPLAGPVVSLLAFPILGVVLPIGLFGLAAGLLLPWVAFFCGAATYGFVTLLIGTLRGLSSLAWCQVDLTWVPPGAWAGYGLGLVVLGDWANLAGLLSARLARPQAVVALPPPEDLPTEVLYRSARELLEVLPEPGATDPVGSRLDALRDLFKAQALELAPDFVTRLESLESGSLGGVLDKRTLGYLALADAYFLASRSPDKAPALLLILKGIENELTEHLLPALRIPLASTRARDVAKAHRDHPYAQFLMEPERPMSLEEVNGLLWAMLTASQTPIKALVRLSRRSASRRLADPMAFFDPCRLPLRLDQIYKKFFLRLEKQTWDWETVRKAREEILGPRQENFFQLLSRAFASPSARAAAPGA